MDPFKKDFAQRVIKNHKVLSEWWASHAKERAPAFYQSIDLRDAGQKIAPVDCNLFPGGFNNICPEDVRTAPKILATELQCMALRYGIQSPKKLVILPETHTHNPYYVDNVMVLKKLIEEAGFEVRVGWLGESPAPVLLGTTPGTELRTESLTITPHESGKSQLSLGDFVPELILINNDFSGGYPEFLDQLIQPAFPHPNLGWHTRKKNVHFLHYNRLAKEFADLIGLDPWHIQIDTEVVDHVALADGVGIDAVYDSVKRILDRTRIAYAEHQIDRKPFVFVKNNAGTYGMGIMVVHSEEEIKTINRRTKNKMSVGKNKSQISSLVIQEGVPTTTLVDRLAAEPVIYLAGGKLIGGFLRANTERNDEDNLNSQGMVFRMLCMSDLRAIEDGEEDGEHPPLELVYGWIARISALATGYELEQWMPKSHAELNTRVACSETAGVPSGQKTSMV